jgi:uncharacterized protein (DUF362 family)
MSNSKRELSRQEFLRLMAGVGAGALLAACGVRPPAQTTAPTALQSTQTGSSSGALSPSTSQATAAPTGSAYLGVARGSDPAALTMAAVAAIGGIERFVKSGYKVIVKPNICTDYYSYEFGATTNPDVVATLVRLALGAGAKSVTVMDLPFGGTSQSAYERSGIGAAVKAAGGQMEVMDQNKYVQSDIPNSLNIPNWKFYKEVLDADLVINVPIAKNHGEATLSLGCKNMMGVVLNRGQIHASLDKRIADLTSRVHPQLTVVDAIRTLMRNGPTGGNLDDVRMTNTVLASHDIVAADTYAASLFNLKPSDVMYIHYAEQLGLGTTDLKSIKITEVAV